MTVIKKLLTICCIGMCAVLSATTIPLHVCTVASHPTSTLAQLSDSCKANGINLDVLGIGQPYKGNGQKLTYLKRYIEQLPEGDVVMFVDAYDTLVLTDSKTIISKFLAYDCHCIVGGETCFCPASRLHYQDQVPDAPTKFKYLNSGTIIGYAGFIKTMLHQIPIDESTSDQGQLWDFYMKHPDDIVIDYYANLFLTLQGVAVREISIDIENRSIHYLPTGTTPIVVHGNGDGKPFYQNMYDKMFKRKFRNHYVWRLQPAN